MSFDRRLCAILWLWSVSVLAHWVNENVLYSEVGGGVGASVAPVEAELETLFVAPDVSYLISCQWPGVLIVTPPCWGGWA